MQFTKYRFFVKIFRSQFILINQPSEPRSNEKVTVVHISDRPIFVFVKFQNAFCI